MCFGGGGGGGGTIVMPDTSAYDRMAEMQMNAMRDVQQGAMQLKQQELDAAIRNQQQTLTQIRDIKKEKADSAAAVEAQAGRLAALIGPPPPEQTAQAPLVGGSRENASASQKKGKSSLRIGRTTTKNYGQGAGLNIT